MRTKLGQSSVEFLSYAAFFLLIFSAATGYLLFGHVQDAARQKGSVAREISGQFADQVNFALSAGDGFFGVFEFERSLLGADYNVTFGPDGFVRIDWQDGGQKLNYLYQIRAKSLTAIEGNGVLIDAGGYITLDEKLGFYSIENKEGRLIISQLYLNVDERFAGERGAQNEAS